MMAVANESFSLIPDWTLLLQAANFFIVVAALSLLVFRPLQKVIERRRAFTTEAKADADRLLEDASQIDIGRKKVLAMALSEAQADREKMLAEAYHDKDILTAEAREKAHKTLAENAIEVDAIRKSLDQDVDRRVSEIAKEIVERVVR